MATKISLVKEYLSTHPCLKCGEINVNILDFDHRNPEEKELSVSDMLTKNINKIMDEIAKCDVLCGNCHRHKTQHQFNTWKAKHCTDKQCPWR